MTMKKIVSVAAALLTVVSSACICPISASAARTTPDDLSAADIAYLHSKGVTDELIARVQQNSNTRSGTQLNHYVWFTYNYISPISSNSTFLELYRPKSISYYGNVLGPAGSVITVDFIGATDSPTAYHDKFHATIKPNDNNNPYANIGMVAAYRYTCADDVFWTYFSYSPTNPTYYTVYTPILMGDIDEDYDVDTTDWVYMYRIHDDDIPAGITGAGLRAADINCNGTNADNTDITKLGQYVAGSIDCFWS